MRISRVGAKIHVEYDHDGIRGIKIHVKYDHDGIRGITVPHDKMLKILNFEVELSPIKLGQPR